NVTLQESGGVTRLDVQVKKTLTGQADLGIIADGGATDLSGTIQVSADVALHIVFGFDSQGFFIDANSHPTLVVNNIASTDADSTEGEGRFNGTDVQLTGGTLRFDP